MAGAIPIIDLRDGRVEVARAVNAACREHGFFYVVGHGIDESLGQRLEALTRQFFALPESTKGAIRDAARGTRVARMVSARR